MSAVVLRGDARRLPLPDACADLIVTSPPYFGLRSYTDGCPTCSTSARAGNRGYMERYCPGCQRVFTSGRNKCHVCDLTTLRTDATKQAPKTSCPDCDGNGQRHYDGQIGSEATPGEWVAALVACTAEWVRVLKPSGSIFVNLGDKYAGGGMGGHSAGLVGTRPQGEGNAYRRVRVPVPDKSLMGLPWRYALACMDELGLILRRDIIWSKPNGLPESVTDRCRSSHEYLFHFTVRPRYYAAVDEIREAYSEKTVRTYPTPYGAPGTSRHGKDSGSLRLADNPLGKLPGSVWEIPSQPLSVPAHLGVDHFACVDTETEILTPRGWLRHDQLAPGDQVAGYDLGSDTARWTECSAVNRYDYDGDMIAVESRDLSMRLTPNHRTIVQRMETRAKRRSPVSVVRADELDRYHYIPRSAAWQPYGDFHHSERLAALMGWVAAEGWYQGKGIWLSQSLEVNGPHVAEIDRLIPAAAVRTERKRTYKGREWTEVTWKLGAIDTIVQREMPDKLLPWRLVMTTEAERRAALDAFIAGDGHRRPDSRIGIYQKYRHNLDVLQAVAVTLGYKTTIREGGGRFVLYLTEGGRSVTLRGTSGVGSKVRREHYTGTVWCPTTGTGTFIARRNGSVFVTGNSFPMELPRRCILGWSPPGICTECGEGRRAAAPQEKYAAAVTAAREDAGLTRAELADRAGCGANNVWDYEVGGHLPRGEAWANLAGALGLTLSRDEFIASAEYVTTGSQDSDLRRSAVRQGAARPYASRKLRIGASRPETCACPDATAPVRPAVVVDPFCGTGTTMLVAAALGRIGIGIDRSMDYARLARWRTADPGEIAKAMQVPKPPPVPDGQASLFDEAS